jgi:hypothetical protein
MVMTGGSVDAPTPIDTTSRTAFYALPKALVPVTVTYAACSLDPCPEPSITVGDYVYVPDGNHVYSIDTDFSAASHDTVVVELTKGGLLSKITTTADDATGLLITKTVELIAKILQAGAALTPPGSMMEKARARPERDKPYPELKLTDTLDVFDENSLRTFNTRLSTLAWRHSKEDASIANVRLLDAPLTPMYAKNKDARCAEGICFRPPLPYTLSLEWGRAGMGKEVIQQTTVLLPNQAPILNINLSRTPFVKRVSSLEFNDGMLSKVNVDKPSEALAALSVPVDALTAIIAIPAQLLTLRIANAQNTTSLYDNQVKLLEAQTKLIKAIEEFKKANPPRPDPQN